MLSLKESILKSNGAGSRKFRFSKYNDEQSVVEIVACNVEGCWDENYIKKQYDLLSKSFKSNIRYVFSKFSKDNKVVYFKLWCLISECKTAEEVEKLLQNCLVNRTKISDVRIDVESNKNAIGRRISDNNICVRVEHTDMEDDPARKTGWLNFFIENKNDIEKQYKISK